MVRLSLLSIGVLVLSVACSPANDPARLSPGRSGLAVVLVDAPTYASRSKGRSS